MPRTTIRSEDISSGSISLSGGSLAIDSSGRVTTPSQPSFGTYLSSTYTLPSSAWSQPPFDTTRWNTGNHYNTSNYSFTAPISGKYLFTAQVQFTSATNIYYYLGFKINGSFYHYLYGFNDARAGDDNTHGGSQIINLSANDVVTFFAYDSNGGNIGAGTLRSYWTGHLLG